jgi:hypothetical protein
MRLEVIPRAFGAIVDRAFGRDDRILDPMWSIDQAFRGREAQADLWIVLVGLDEAHTAEIDEDIPRNEVPAMALERLRPMIAEPSRIGRDEIRLLPGAPDDLAVGDAGAPGKFGARQHGLRQRHQFIAFQKREDFEERRHWTYTAVLLEVHLPRHMAAGDLARRRIDDQRLDRHDGAEAQRRFRICRDGVVVERIGRRAEPADGERGQDAQFLDCLLAGHLRLLPWP